MKNKKSKNNNQKCALAYEVFCDLWNLRIINSLRNGECRFNEVQKSLDINTATLACRLKSLEQLRFVKRTEAAIDRQSVTYCLTNTGKKCLPIYDDIMKLQKNL